MPLSGDVVASEDLKKEQSFQWKQLGISHSEVLPCFVVATWVPPLRPPKTAGISREVPQREKLMDFSFQPNFFLAKICESINSKMSTQHLTFQAYRSMRSISPKSLQLGLLMRGFVESGWTWCPSLAQPSCSQRAWGSRPQGCLFLLCSSPSLYPTSNHHVAPQPADT